MPTEPTITPPRRRHLGVNALGLGASVLVTFGAAAGMGGSLQTALVAATVMFGAVLVGSVAALAGEPMPLFRWALLTMGAGLVRLAALLIAGLQVDFMLTLDRTAFWMALVAGGALMLVIESAFLIRTISGWMGEGGMGEGTMSGKEGSV